MQPVTISFHNFLYTLFIKSNLIHKNSLISFVLYDDIAVKNAVYLLNVHEFDYGQKYEGGNPMKKILLIALALLLCLGSVAQAAEFDLSIAHIVAEDNSWHKASVFFKEEVEKRSNGRIGVTIYPNSQLGTEVEQIQSALTGGGVDIVITGESMMTFAPEMGVLGIP